MAKNGLPSYLWTIVAFGILYSVFSFTRKMSAHPMSAYVSGDAWKYWPRGFWSGRPVAPPPGYPGLYGPAPEGPHTPPQGPAHGPPKPGGIDHPILH